MPNGAAAEAYKAELIRNAPLEQRLAGVTPEQRLAGVTPREVVRALTPEQLAELVAQLPPELLLAASKKHSS